MQPFDAQISYPTALGRWTPFGSRAIRNGLMDAPEGLGLDIRTFFSLPVPRAVWDSKRHFQDAEFVAFVEKQIATTKSPFAAT